MLKLFQSPLQSMNGFPLTSVGSRSTIITWSFNCCGTEGRCFPDCSWQPPSTMMYEDWFPAELKWKWLQTHFGVQILPFWAKNYLLNKKKPKQNNPTHYGIWLEARRIFSHTVYDHEIEILLSVGHAYDLLQLQSTLCPCNKRKYGARCQNLLLALNKTQNMLKKTQHVANNHRIWIPSLYIALSN